MQCELCGREEDSLYKTKIEGIFLNVCEGCSRYGAVIKVPTPPRHEKNRGNKQFSGQNSKHAPEPEVIETLVPDFSSIIKNRRESLNLKQEELAKNVAEKESLVHKIESGHFRPPISMARKFEKILRVRLVEVIKLDGKNADSGHLKNKELTIGDFVKIRNK